MTVARQPGDGVGHPWSDRKFAAGEKVLGHQLGRGLAVTIPIKQIPGAAADAINRAARRLRRAALRRPRCTNRWDCSMQPSCASARRARQARQARHYSTAAHCCVSRPLEAASASKRRHPPANPPRCGAPSCLGARWLAGLTQTSVRRALPIVKPSTRMAQLPSIGETCNFGTGLADLDIDRPTRAFLCPE